MTVFDTGPQHTVSLHQLGEENYNSAILFGYQYRMWQSMSEN